tara:strand:+ start:635 stop:2692 length:2058 start_codon:yes stop_codon:yes gene_type:complete
MRACRSVAWILVCGVIGVGVGLGLTLSGADKMYGVWLGMPGQLYLRALKLLVVPLVFCSVVTGFMSLGDMGISTGRLGRLTATLYMMTTALAAAEGLIITYMLMPIWNTHAANSVSVRPSSCEFDEMPLVTISDLRETHSYFNATTAAYVSFRFAGAPQSTTVSSLQFLYENSVSFKLPAAVGASGPYEGQVESISVFDARDRLVLAAPDTSLLIKEIPGRQSVLHGSIQALLFSIVPDNLIEIIYGGRGQPNLLSLIVFAVAFAMAMLAVKQRSHGGRDVLTPVVQQTLDAVLVLVLRVVDLTPIAVGSLLIAAFSNSSLEQLAKGMASLGVMLAGVHAAFAWHCFVTMPLLVFIRTRANPYEHLLGMGRAVSVAFGSASSAVTLPTSIECCEALGYQPAIVRFVASLGATISMDGTAIYIPSATIWLAAQAGITMSFAQVLMLAIIAILASAGASPTPGLVAGMVLIWGSIFPEVPLPHEFSYLMALDWLIDRALTTTNILGDSCVVKIVDHSFPKLQVLPQTNTGRANGGAGGAALVEQGGSQQGSQQILPRKRRFTPPGGAFTERVFQAGEKLVRGVAASVEQNPRKSPWREPDAGICGVGPLCLPGACSHASVQGSYSGAPARLTGWRPGALPASRLPTVASQEVLIEPDPSDETPQETQRQWLAGQQPSSTRGAGFMSQ